MDLTTYKGSCHCGRVTFTLQAKPLTQAVECNCSMCGRAGALWHAASDADLKILTGESELAVYQFGTLRAKHYFCRHCGIHPFTRPRLDPTRWAVNVRCIDAGSIDAMTVVPFDGLDWERGRAAYRD